MSDFIISSESIMDLTNEYVKELGVSFIKSNYELDGKIFLDDFGKSLDMDSFYKNMEKGSSPSTSAINTQEYINYFKQMLEEGKDILHVCLSSGLSIQYSCLLQAIDILKEDYPERKIYPIDSKMASSGVGLLIKKLVAYKNEGLSIEELYQWAKDNCLHVICYTSNENLEYLARGGRLSKTAAGIGKHLHICPLIQFDDTGHMFVGQKIRTKKKLINTMIKKMQENAYNGLDYADDVFVNHAKNEDLAIEVKDMLLDNFKNLKEVKIFNIGPTIGSHIGPGAISIFFWGKSRKE